MSTKIQPSAMEIDTNAPSSTKGRKCATIMDKVTLLDKCIRIPNPE
jgi:hypothetical protein